MVRLGALLVASLAASVVTATQNISESPAPAPMPVRPNANDTCTCQQKDHYGCVECGGTCSVGGTCQKWSKNSGSFIGCGYEGCHCVVDPPAPPPPPAPQPVPPSPSDTCACDKRNHFKCLSCSGTCAMGGGCDLDEDLNECLCQVQPPTPPPPPAPKPVPPSPEDTCVCDKKNHFKCLSCSGTCSVGGSCYLDENANACVCRVHPPTPPPPFVGTCACSQQEDYRCLGCTGTCPAGGSCELIAKDDLGGITSCGNGGCGCLFDGPFEHQSDQTATSVI